MLLKIANMVHAMHGKTKEEIEELNKAEREYHEAQIDHPNNAKLSEVCEGLVRPLLVGTPDESPTTA